MSQKRFYEYADENGTRAADWIGSDAQGYSLDGYDVMDAQRAAHAGISVDSTDSSEWPYLWAFTTPDAPNVVSVYTEGDRTFWTFPDAETAAEAWRLWQQTTAEFAEEVAVEVGHDSEGIGAAVLAFLKEYGDAADIEDADAFRAWEDARIVGVTVL